MTNKPEPVDLPAFLPARHAELEAGNPANPLKGPRGHTVVIIAAIKGIWQAGDSAGQIANKLKAMQIDYSRNSVIGLFARHLEYLKPCYLQMPVVAGAKQPRTPLRSIDSASVKRAAATQRQVNDRLPQGGVVEYERPAVPLPPDWRGLSLVELKPGECKFPHGNVQFTFCGAHASDGPYCGYHARICNPPGQAKVQRKRYTNRSLADQKRKVI